MGSASLLFKLQVSWNRLWYINLVSFHSVMSTHFFECVQSVHCLPYDTFSHDKSGLSYGASQTWQPIYPLSFPSLHSNCNCHPSISSHHVSVPIHTLDLTPLTTQVQASLTLCFTSGTILTPNCRRKDSSENWQCFSQFLSSSAMHLSNLQFTDITYKGLKYKITDVYCMWGCHLLEH
jgi:hypothetical protein